MFRNFMVSVNLIGILWGIHFVDMILPLDLRLIGGLYPRTVKGLVGIVFSPLLHGNVFHLLSNTVSFFVLSFVLLTFYKNSFWRVIILVTLIANSTLWLFGRSAYHIGISTLIFGMITFLSLYGWVHRQLWKGIIGFGILMFYGGTLLSGIIPTRGWVSWEGHLFGAIAGILVTFLVKDEGVAEDLRNLEGASSDDSF